MTEEIIENVEELDTEEIQEDITPEELKAIEGGWRPQEEWEGEDNEWIDARTFNMRGELMDRIKSQTSQLRGQDRKIQKLETTMERLAEHNRKMDEVAYNKALKELKGLKRDALDMADHDQVVEIDEQINELKSLQKTEEVQVDDSNNINPEVAEWVSQNEWYSKDVTLRGAADALAIEIVQAFPELRGRPSEVLSKVTDRLKTEFPTKFGKTTRRGTTQSVAEPGQGDTASRTKGSAKKYTSKHLNETQLEYGRNFVQDGIMKDLNEYAAQLAEIGELDSQKGA